MTNNTETLWYADKSDQFVNNYGMTFFLSKFFLVKTMQTIGWNDISENGEKYLEISILTRHSKATELVRSKR